MLGHRTCTRVIEDVASLLTEQDMLACSFIYLIFVVLGVGCLRVGCQIGFLTL